jgi:hypothetical protein
MAQNGRQISGIKKPTRWPVIFHTLKKRPNDNTDRQRTARIRRCLSFFERKCWVGASASLSTWPRRAGQACLMVEGKIPMAARRHVTNNLWTAYARASKQDKAKILAEVVATTGPGRSTARWMLTGPALPDPAEQVDKRKQRQPQLPHDRQPAPEHGILGSVDPSTPNNEIAASPRAHLV